jgi:hypothetical protein
MATWTFYNKWKKRQLSTATDFSAGNIQFLLLKAGTLIGGQTPVNAANTGDSGNAFVSDLVPGTNEVTGTNYARTALGTQGLSGPTSGVVTFAGAGVTYAQSGAGFTNAQYVVLFDNGPAPMQLGLLSRWWTWELRSATSLARSPSTPTPATPSLR